jgi:hypothetical protein
VESNQIIMASVSTPDFVKCIDECLMPKAQVKIKESWAVSLLLGVKRTLVCVERRGSINNEASKKKLVASYEGSR